MDLKNFDIRKAIEEAGLYYWEVALHYGINDCNFSRLLRKDLTCAQKERITKIIKEMKAQKK